MSPIQLLKGINSTQASTAVFGKAFSKGIASVLNVTVGSIQITSISAVTARRSLTFSADEPDMEDERMLGESKIH